MHAINYKRENLGILIYISAVMHHYFFHFDFIVDETFSSNRHLIILNPIH